MKLSPHGTCFEKKEESAIIKLLVALLVEMEQISEQKRIKPLKVQLGNVTPANILQLKSINISTLPVRYTDKFYKDLIANGPHENLKFAFWNGFAIGAVCARIEVHDTVPDANKLYIMTINVLGPYRRRGIGEFCSFNLDDSDL